jgi:tetratricopeptide (TPR) repeat protein
MQDRIDEAEALYRRALQIEPRDVHAVAGLIDIGIARGEFNETATEFLALFDDEAFLAHNRLDTMPLAHGYRLAARLCWHAHDWQRANDLYCRSFAIYFDSGERQEELQAFLADARRNGAELRLDPKYEAPRHRPRMGDGWKGIGW